MRLLLLTLIAGLPLAACAPTSAPRADAPGSNRAPDNPLGVRPVNPGYRDAKPDTDPYEPRLSPGSQPPRQKPVTPVYTR